MPRLHNLGNGRDEVVIKNRLNSARNFFFVEIITGKQPLVVQRGMSPAMLLTASDECMKRAEIQNRKSNKPDRLQALA